MYRGLGYLVSRPILLELTQKLLISPMVALIGLLKIERTSESFAAPLETPSLVLLGVLGWVVSVSNRERNQAMTD